MPSLRVVLVTALLVALCEARGPPIGTWKHSQGQMAEATGGKRSLLERCKERWRETRLDHFRCTLPIGSGPVAADTTLLLPPLPPLLRSSPSSSPLCMQLGQPHLLQAAILCVRRALEARRLDFLLRW